MRFEQPGILNLLWALPLLWVGLRWLGRRRQRLLARFAQEGLISSLADTYDPRRARWKQILWTLVMALSIVALARPQWGFEWQEITRQGLDILIAIDTSKSMLTQDVRPNRLERTKLAVKDLLGRLRGDRVGLIAFAGQAFLTCPLTVDLNGFLLSLEDLDTATIPRGGTNLAQAIEEASREYDQTPSRYKAVIILTDGENLEGDPLSAAKKAKQKGIKIYCVGIGTPEGELIQIENAAGAKEFLKDESGNFVKSRLNEKLLQEIALTSGGIYLRGGGADFGLDWLYDQELAKMERRDIENQKQQRFFERFQWPLALALLLLVVETGLSTRREMEP